MTPHKSCDQPACLNKMEGRTAMERERMNRLLELHKGIGVIAVNHKGFELCYFYEDFDGPASGIRRAMAQLYPLQAKGVITSLTFVENARKSKE